MRENFYSAHLQTPQNISCKLWLSAAICRPDPADVQHSCGLPQSGWIKGIGDRSITTILIWQCFTMLVSMSYFVTWVNKKLTWYVSSLIRLSYLRIPFIASQLFFCSDSTSVSSSLTWKHQNIDWKSIDSQVAQLKAAIQLLYIHP